MFDLTSFYPRGEILIHLTWFDINGIFDKFDFSWDKLFY